MARHRPQNAALCPPPVESWSIPAREPSRGWAHAADACPCRRSGDLHADACACGRSGDHSAPVDSGHRFRQREARSTISSERGKTVHGEPANAGHRVLAPDDAEVEAYLETALHAGPPDRADEPGPATPDGSAESDTPDSVVVLDFGGQFAQLIARRVRELHVYSELLPFDTPYADLIKRGARGVILSGGPMSVYDQGAPKPDPAIWSGRIPVLGICYGAQLMALELGGDVAAATRREYGSATIQITSEDGVFAGLEREQPVWMSHGDSITRLPAGFVSTAQTDSTPYAGLVDPQRRLYGIQFHPEVAHTPRGRDVLRNFVQGIAGARATWTPANFIESTVAQIRERVDAHARATGSDGRVICALSGGVDSAVAAVLVHRAVGDRLTCIYVDHGLMRKRESELLRQVFEANLGMKLVMVDARQRFLARLAGVEDPEEKRRIIGDEFIRVFEQESAELGRIDFLTQGTLYPDVIETTAPETKAAQKIKTHHNVGGLPADLRFQLIEPLRYLFKDEVRQVGLELGLPEQMVLRQPFPGPGLAIRIIGEVTAERLETLRDADWIVIDEIKAAGLYRSLWQSFAILTPVRSVGVMGDGRTYANVVAIRAVTSEDGMTADWAKLPYDVLGKISSRIVNEVRGVNRVVYDISSKPPATIEWE
jgi:GMP synthase (glutamine-hydrolysing)